MQADLITISRQYGAGAGELATLLGAELGWRVVHTEIPLAVATRLGIPSDALESWDEHAPGVLESIGSSFLLGSPELLITPGFAGRPDARDVAAATRAFLEEVAATPPVIIVGHGAQVIFGGRPRSLHLRLAAPLSSRVPRIMARRRCTEREAAEIVERVDRDRAHYVKEFLGRDVQDPYLYALQVNTGKVAMAEAATLVRKLVHARPETKETTS